MSSGIRAASSAARRRAIMDAALELFVENGMSTTTLEQILDRSGASVGSFYHHFKSKADVGTATYMDILVRYCDGFLAEVRAHTGAKEGIKAGVRYHFRWVRRNFKAAMYIVHLRESQVVRESSVQINGLLRKFFDQLGDWLRVEAEEKAVRSLTFDTYWALWQGPAEMFTRYWLVGPRDEMQLKRAEATLADAAWKSLRRNRLSRP
jgi:AcrR family transcriptional regulator